MDIMDDLMGKTFPKSTKRKTRKPIHQMHRSMRVVSSSSASSEESETSEDSDMSETDISPAHQKALGKAISTLNHKDRAVLLKLARIINDSTDQKLRVGKPEPRKTTSPKHPEHPEVSESERKCETCLWKGTKWIEKWRCINPVHKGEVTTCNWERRDVWDGRWHKCGAEGMLWEPRPETVVDKIKKKIKHAVHGSESKKTFKDKLVELFKGPKDKER